MAIDTTWTDPSTGGAIDLDAGEQLTAVVWDKVLSNLKHLAGVNGYHIKPGVSSDRMIESGNIAVNAGASQAVSFTTTFGAAPNVATAINQASQHARIGSVATTGFTMYNDGGSNGTCYWIAEGLAP